MNEDSLAKTLVELIEKVGGKTVSDDDIMAVRYLDRGYLDSMAIVEFIVAVEEAFDIDLDPQDTESEAFRTVGGLVTIISKKLG